VLCTLVVIVTNLGVSVLFHNHRRQALFASFLAALLLLGAGQLLGTNPENTLPARIMAKFGFGGQAVRLVVTGLGGRERQGPGTDGRPAAGGGRLVVDPRQPRAAAVSGWVQGGPWPGRRRSLTSRFVLPPGG
jgi:hypothetical protein